MSVMKRVHEANDYVYICIVCNKKSLHRNIPVQGQMRQDWCGGDVVPRDTGREMGLKVPALSTPALLLKFISREREVRNSIDSRSW